MPRTVKLLELQTHAAEELVDLTSRVKSIVQQSGVESGLVVVHCPHTTAAIAVQENTDPGLREDILEALDRAVPKDKPYRHTEENAPAHVKAAMLGASATVPIDAGRPMLGTWQAIYFVELDGPRRRTVQVKVIAG